MRIFYQLLDGITCHAAAPYDSALRIDKEPDREHFHAVLLDRLYQRPPLFFHRIRAAILRMKHLRHGRSVYIGIQQPYAVARLRQSDSQVRRHSRFADSALAAVDSNDMLRVDERIGLLTGSVPFRLSTNGFGMDLHLYIGVYIRLQRCLGSFQHRFHERVVILRKNQGERHLKTRDTDIVLQHSAFYQILPRAGITYVPQSVNNLLWIHKTIYR